LSFRPEGEIPMAHTIIQIPFAGKAPWILNSASSIQDDI
jgi:hypothetical protein